MPLAIRVTADRAARRWGSALHAVCTNRTGRDNPGRDLAAARENAEGKLSPVSAEVAANTVPAFLARLWHKPCHLSTAEAGNASVTEGLTAKNAETGEEHQTGSTGFSGLSWASCYPVKIFVSFPPRLTPVSEG